MSRFTYEVVLSSTGAGVDAVGPDGTGAFTHRGSTDGALSAVNFQLVQPDGIGTLEDQVGLKTRLIFDAPSRGDAGNTTTFTVRASGFSNELASVVATIVAPSAAAGNAFNSAFGGDIIVIIDTNNYCWEYEVPNHNLYATTVTAAGYNYQGPSEGRLRYLGYK